MSYKTVDGITSSVIPFCVKDGDCFVLLGKRKSSSLAFPSHWCIVGGFLNVGEECLEEAAVRELQEETGLVAALSQLELITVQSDPKRDPRGVVIDHVYAVQFQDEEKASASDDLEDVMWLPLHDALAVNLAFDHDMSLYLFAVKEGFI